MLCIYETGQNVFGISDTGTYLFCEMFFYLSSFELIFSEKTNICCCELKHFRLFPVNPRPSPRCCRLRGNRLWFCAETPCQACHTSLPGSTADLPPHHTSLRGQACHTTTPGLPSYHTGKQQVRPGKGKLLTSLKVSSKGKATPLAMPQHVLPFAIRFSIWHLSSVNGDFEKVRRAHVASILLIYVCICICICICTCICIVCLNVVHCCTLSLCYLGAETGYRVATPYSRV